MRGLERFWGMVLFARLEVWIGFLVQCALLASERYVHEKCLLGMSPFTTSRRRLPATKQITCKLAMVWITRCIKTALLTLQLPIMIIARVLILPQPYSHVALTKRRVRGVLPRRDLHRR